MGNCSSVHPISEAVAEATKEKLSNVHNLLLNVDDKDLGKIEHALSLGWEVYDKLNREDKDKIKILSAKYFH